MSSVRELLNSLGYDSGNHDADVRNALAVLVRIRRMSSGVIASELRAKPDDKSYSPGALIQRLVLEPNGITAEQLADHLGVDPREIHLVLEGAALTPDLIIRLGQVFSGGMRWWADINQPYLIHLLLAEHPDLADDVRKIAPLHLGPFGLAIAIFGSVELLADTLDANVEDIRGWASGTQSLDQRQDIRGKERSRPGFEVFVTIRDLLVVAEQLYEFLEPSVAPEWLLGKNIRLGGRPVDFIRQGRTPEVLDAIAAERQGAFV